MFAEDRVWIHRTAACRAVWTGVTAENLAGDIRSLLSVVLAYTAGHEEGFNPAKDSRNSGPGQNQIDEAGAVAPKIKVVNPKAAQEDSEKNADDFIPAGMLIFGVEPAALMVGHIRGINRICDLHMECSRLTTDVHTRTESMRFRDTGASSATESVAIYSPKWSA